MAEITLLRGREVRRITGLSESSLYRLMRAGSFPRPVSLTNKRAVAWCAGEVRAWVEARANGPRRGVRPYEHPDDEDTLVPAGEPTPAMVRDLIAARGHTVTSAAMALGLQRRTLERFVTDGPRWRKPRPVILAALNVLAPPRRSYPAA